MAQPAAVASRDPARPRVGDVERRRRRLCGAHDGARWISVPRDDDARQAEGEEAARRDAARFAAQRIEVRELGLAEDLDAGRHDALEMPREREPRLLHARVAKRPTEASLACDTA